MAIRYARFRIRGVIFLKSDGQIVGSSLMHGRITYVLFIAKSLCAAGTPVRRSAAPVDPTVGWPALRGVHTEHGRSMCWKASQTGADRLGIDSYVRRPARFRFRRLTLVTASPACASTESPVTPGAFATVRHMANCRGILRQVNRGNGAQQMFGRMLEMNRD